MRFTTDNLDMKKTTSLMLVLILWVRMAALPGEGFQNSWALVSKSPSVGRGKFLVIGFRCLVTAAESSYGRGGGGLQALLREAAKTVLKIETYSIAYVYAS